MDFTSVDFTLKASVWCLLVLLIELPEDKKANLEAAS